MFPINGTALSKRRVLRLLPCLFCGLALAGAVWAEQPQTAAAITLGKQLGAAPATYRIINLGPGELASIPKINVSGQVAYTLAQPNGPWRGWFYDGSVAVDVGTLGGSWAIAAGVNNAGQVVGTASLPNAPFTHAFVWTRHSGMLDLGTLFGLGSSFGVAINNRGQATGSSFAPDGTTHAFRWSAANGMEDVGLFAPFIPNFTNATAIGETGLVAGWGTVADGDGHAFAWTRRTGLLDLGTFGGSSSFAEAVDAEGQVAGYATVPGNRAHAFVWNRSRGLMDLGTAGGIESGAQAMAANGHVAGVINFFAGNQHAFSWTRAGGMVDLGTLGGANSSSLAVNNHGQIVGGSNTRRGDFHAFVWSSRVGMVDLNKRLRHAPAGLVVDVAVAISDNGSIVATSNAGLVLLKPDCGCRGTHAAGPIAVADMVEVGAAFDASVSFAGADTTARHNVFWSFGDGSGERAGNARADHGVGSATGRHTYTTPGIYTITANVVDLAGKSATVSRTIVAYDKSRGGVGGSGWFMSPQGANRQEPRQAGKAAFSFVSPSAASATANRAQAELRFHVGTLSFRSEDLRPVAVHGARGQFEGRGTINGKGDYQFALATTSNAAAGGGEPGRFDLRIWHIDPATKAPVVDYDNQLAGSRSAGSVAEGIILLQQ